MAFSPTDLYAEVLAVISGRCAEGLDTSRGWLVTAVLLQHPVKRHQKKDPDEFSICCRQLAVAVAVDKALAKLKHQEEGGDPDAAELDLPKLPGYKHLRRVYPVRREGVIFLVALERMSDEEIDAKAETYKRASRGFAEHADELERYCDARRRGKAA